jgi:hypothetical protein
MAADDSLGFLLGDGQAFLGRQLVVFGTEHSTEIALL